MLLHKSRKLILALALVPFALGATPAFAVAEVGQPAPDFTATDIKGNEVKLSDLKGKNVVLEWTNQECPFVVKHYKSGNMQAVQKTATEGGAVWISINSSAPGMQGNTTAEEAVKIETDAGVHSTNRILDPNGDIGQLYGAKTTPHMFVINAEGNVAYAGAIDSVADADPASIAGASNYVLAALDDLKAGNPVQTPTTTPYGCGVKYKATN
ncbi:MAG: redoxin domain-containing protein [Alphaproteobacteria bacterium]|jgi:peroxiredoxin|nr:redoxin domain-containing protein [Alphaproteobacteria bacterium]QQS57413.1 MAG: redoxin domain-containing protein [Alphaproteobacteria bacterium]